MTREYLTLAAEILTEAVNDGELTIDDYCFDVIAMGFRRLDSRALASQLRQEEDAELAKLTLEERAIRILTAPEPVRETYGLLAMTVSSNGELTTETPDTGAEHDETNADRTDENALPGKAEIWGALRRCAPLRQDHRRMGNPGIGRACPSSLGSR
jgi:hypothetical protein